MRYSAALTATALLASGLPALAAPNLVVNDSFEAGSFPSWVTAGDIKGLSVAQMAPVFNAGRAARTTR